MLVRLWLWDAAAKGSQSQLRWCDHDGQSGSWVVQWGSFLHIHELLRSSTFALIWHAEVTLRDYSNTVLQQLFYCNYKVCRISGCRNHFALSACTDSNYSFTSGTGMAYTDNSLTHLPWRLLWGKFLLGFWRSIEYYLPSSTTCSQVMLLSAKQELPAFNFHITWYLSSVPFTNTRLWGLFWIPKRVNKILSWYCMGGRELPNRLLYLRSSTRWLSLYICMIFPCKSAFLFYSRTFFNKHTIAAVWKSTIPTHRNTKSWKSKTMKMLRQL